MPPEPPLSERFNAGDSVRSLSDGEAGIDSSSKNLARRAGPIVWVTLSRPEKANALDWETLAQLHDILVQSERDKSVRALIFSGAGRNFCAGADLAELLNGGSHGVRRFLHLLRRFLLGLERSHLISIAAVHGAARAGGLELALACDIILAARSASFGDAHVANGILPGGGSTVRLPRAIGWQRAKWLILSGAAIDAKTAREWGLAFDVVDDAGLMDSAQLVAEGLIQANTEVLGHAKHLLAGVGERSLSASLEIEIATFETHYHSEAFQSGVTRFLKRPKRGEQ
jgi:enoyl-CoA hydratase/carnithine racemase